MTRANDQINPRCYQVHMCPKNGGGKYFWVIFPNLNFGAFSFTLLVNNPMVSESDWDWLRHLQISHFSDYRTSIRRKQQLWLSRHHKGLGEGQESKDEPLECRQAETAIINMLLLALVSLKHLWPSHSCYKLTPLLSSLDDHLQNYTLMWNSLNLPRKSGSKSTKHRPITILNPFFIIKRELVPLPKSLSEWN